MFALSGPPIRSTGRTPVAVPVVICRLQYFASSWHYYNGCAAGGLLKKFVEERCPGYDGMTKRSASSSRHCGSVSMSDCCLQGIQPCECKGEGHRWVGTFLRKVETTSTTVSGLELILYSFRGCQDQDGKVRSVLLFLSLETILMKIFMSHCRNRVYLLTFL